jgi:hypothetical protein
MLTMLTQNSGFRRSAGCISREWRQKGEFSASAEWLPEWGSALRPKFSVGSSQCGPSLTVHAGLQSRFRDIEIR